MQTHTRGIQLHVLTHGYELISPFALYFILFLSLVLHNILTYCRDSADIIPRHPILSHGVGLISFLDKFHHAFLFVSFHFYKSLI